MQIQFYTKYASKLKKSNNALNLFDFRPEKKHQHESFYMRSIFNNQQYVRLSP